MPGRPKGMLGKITKLEQPTVDIIELVFKGLPKDVRESRKQHYNEPLLQAWRDAWLAVAEFGRKVHALGDIARARAEVAEPGLLARYFRSSVGETGDDDSDADDLDDDDFEDGLDDDLDDDFDDGPDEDDLDEDDGGGEDEDEPAGSEHAALAMSPSPGAPAAATAGGTQPAQPAPAESEPAH